MATEIIVPKWDPLDNPECTNCRGLSRPIRPKKKPESCGLVQIGLSKTVKVRRRILQLISDARLPRAELAQMIFNINPATLYRHLNGGEIRASEKDYYNRIESVSRQGQYTTVVYWTGPESHHWPKMLRNRARKSPRPKRLSYTELPSFSEGIQA